MNLVDISENVLNLLDMAASMNEFQFEEEDVEGKVHEVESESEEDMIVYACYIAECLTFKKEIDISKKGIQLLRCKIVDTIVRLTQL